jgi:hypothetical protein
MYQKQIKMKAINKIFKKIKIRYNTENDITEYQYLSEGLIRKFKNKVSWTDISEYQKFSEKLSEDLIRKFKNKVSWTDI